MKSAVSKITLGAGCILLIIGAVLIYREQSQTFPYLKEGYYAGSMLRIDGSRFNFLWEIQAKSLLMFTSGAQNGEAQGKLEVRSTKNQDSVTFYPVALDLQGEILRFSGFEREGGARASGIIRNRLAAEAGTWEVRRIEAPLLTGETASKEWLDLVSRLDSSKQNRDAAESMIRDTEEKLDRTRTLVSDVKNVVSSAKFAETRDRSLLLAALKEEEALTKETERLHEQLELAQRLSPMGRLLYLSREVLVREAQPFWRAMGDRDEEGDEG